MKAFIIAKGRPIYAFKLASITSECYISKGRWTTTKKENMFFLENIVHDPIIGKVQDPYMLGMLNEAHDGEVKFDSNEYYIFEDSESNWHMAIHKRYVEVG